MTYLKFNQIMDRKGKMMTLLSKLGLEPDERMKKTLEDNPEYVQRLARLYHSLKKNHIPLDDELHDLIDSHITDAGILFQVLEFMKKEGIDAALLPKKVLFDSAKFGTYLIQSLEQLKTHGSLDLSLILLLMNHSEHSILLANSIFKLQQHAYPTKNIVAKLNTISPKNIDTFIRLITLLLDENLYYFDCLDIFVRQQEYLQVIYEGCKKLASQNKLDLNFLSVVETNPGNANLLANLILLLNNASLIDYRKKPDLITASKLGIGAYHFLNNLAQAGILNHETFKAVCQDDSVLTNPEVIELFCHIPLFEEFLKDELVQMLQIMQQPSPQKHLNEFIEILSNHQVIKGPGAP
ncbi:hypothetical protein [Legionella wadsworthii]|nr:hypothetical protein [Legionella wadsworthii]